MLGAGDEAVRLGGVWACDKQPWAEARFDGEALPRQGIEAPPLLILGSNVTSVTAWHAVCASLDAVIALVAVLALALAGGGPTPPARLVVEPGLLARLQTLAAGLHSEIVLCLTGTSDGVTAVATGFTMPDPQFSASDHATFGPCPKETV